MSLKDTRETDPQTLSELRLRNMLLARAQKCIRRVRLLDCLRLVRKIEELPTFAAVPALCYLLKRPRNFRGYLAYNRPRWASMRIRSIQMLRRLADDDAIPSLIYVLLHDLPEVRRHAASALVDFGPQAGEALADAMSTSAQWNLDGMLDLIETIAATDYAYAAPAIAAVLTDYVPGTPDRWLRRHMFASAICGALFTTVGMFAVLPYIGVQLSKAELCTLVAAVWSIISVLAGLVLAGTGFFRRQKNEERYALQQQAADTLIMLQDVSCIPALTDLLSTRCAFSARAAAEDALKSLLPLLRTADRGILHDDNDSMGGGKRVHALLRSSDGALLLATVLALEVVGTSSALAPLERLMTRKPPRTGRDEFAKARLIAQRVLPYLRDLKRREEDPQMLLRQGDGSYVQSNEMLRPSATRHDTHGTLLRPNFVGIKPGGDDSNTDRRR